MALDYEKHPVLGRLPSTLHEHFRVNPMGATSYPKWIEDRVWELLQRPAQLQEYPGGCVFFGPPLKFPTLHEVLDDMRIRVTAPNQRRVRVSLIDGTIIKEWHDTKTQQSQNVAVKPLRNS